MYKQHPYYIQVYERLLADIRALTRLPLGTPDVLTRDWVLIEAPKLDKQLLSYIEGKEDYPSFPEWIRPLSTRFWETSDPVLLKHLRTLLVFCYKIEVDYTDDQASAAQAAFLDVDSSIGIWDIQHATYHRTTIEACARLVSRIIAKINWNAITPAHGPGAVYPTRKPDRKSDFKTIYNSIERFYPYFEYFHGLPSYYCGSQEDPSTALSVQEDIVAKLTAVPKDSRGPRLIAVHPAESIWIQQGQRMLLERAISSHPLTTGRINFTDQSVNGSLALSSSLSRDFVTLDLKEASDRISCALVRSFFGKYAYDVLSCTRATHIKMLDGRLKLLQKWAPMGNCLTFPMQSLIFWVIVYYAIRSRYGENCREIYVFGDDIIYPTKYHTGVIELLVAFGLVPNTAKTFVKGFFRESCGVDAYQGVDVTPLRCRRDNIDSTEKLISYLDLAKRLRLQGYEYCASFIYATIRQGLSNPLSGIINGVGLRKLHLPLINNPDCSGLVEYVNYRFDKLLCYEPSLKFKRGIQQWGVSHRVVTTGSSPVYNGEWFHLQDALLRNNGASSGTQYLRPYAARLTYGWTSALY